MLEFNLYAKSHFQHPKLIFSIQAIFIIFSIQVLASYSTYVFFEWMRNGEAALVNARF